MKHRGPDANGVIENDSCTLGHVRLSIIDLSSDANQPMVDSKNSVVLSYNGEIYNYKEIRKVLELKGIIFRTHSDTEVILNAYIEYGERFVEKLDGMFAIAIYDKLEDTLHLYRDQFGKKPLLYFTKQDKLFFASELKALLYSKDCPTTISEDAFFSYLTFQYSLTSEFIIDGIHKLPPASYLKKMSGKPVQIINYWKLLDHPCPHGGGTDAEIISELFFKSVKKRLIADVPIGVLLSGGVDSSAIAVAMSRMSTQPIKTFTAGFGAYDDEFPFARQIAQQENTEHIELTINLNDILDELPNIVWFMDEPLADGGGIATYFVARKLKEYIKVVLVGEGGDELFGGYSWHKMGYGFFNYVPEAIKKWLYFYLNSFAPQIIRKQGVKKVNYFFNSFEKELCSNDFLCKMTNFERHSLLPNSLLMKVDRMTMAFGIEARVPFLDEDLLRYVISIPPNNRLGKKIFKQSMVNYLPASILNRKKQGFRMPFETWLNTGLKDHARENYFLFNKACFHNSKTNNRQIIALLVMR
jgi:asparagine synthase (glutamine-hydrolysing)